MKKVINYFSLISLPIIITLISTLQSFAQPPVIDPNEFDGGPAYGFPEYFNLRPALENSSGYSQAVKIGDVIKISRVVSVDDLGNSKAKGDLFQQMKNCYSDISKILAHFDCNYNMVVVENIFTTNMPEFIRLASYRNFFYKLHFPTGFWVEVKQLSSPDYMIEIDIEVHKRGRLYKRIN